MGTLVIKSSSLNRTADYTDTTSGLRINLNYQLDDTDKSLIAINGSIYKTADDSFAGNFSGNKSGETMEYNFSGVKLVDMPAVYAAVGDIETQITNEE